MRSPQPTSIMEPTLTKAEKPTFSMKLLSRMAVMSAPLWLRNPTFPGRAMPEAKVALRPVSGFITPRQLGPMMRMRPCCASSRTCLSSSAPSGPVSLKPAEMMIAPPTPDSTHSWMISGTAGAGAAMTARSTRSGTSETLGYAFMPRTFWRRSLPRTSWAGSPVLRFFMAAPSSLAVSGQLPSAVAIPDEDTCALSGEILDYVPCAPVFVTSGVRWESEPDYGLRSFPNDVLEESPVRDAVKVAVLGADGDRGVSEFLDGALDAVHGDDVSYPGTVLDVAACGYVAGEEGEPLAEGEGGDETDRPEDDYGEQDKHVGLEPDLLGGEERRHCDHGREHDAPEDVRAAKPCALRLAGDELGEPPGAHHPGYEDDERHERAAREVDDLVHRVLERGEAEDAQRAGDAGEDDAPEEHEAEQARGPAFVAELQKRVRGPCPLEELVQAELLQESGYQALEEQCDDERCQEHDHGGHQPGHELGQHAEKAFYSSHSGPSSVALPPHWSQVEIIDQCVEVRSAQSAYERLGLPEESRGVGPSDGVADNHLWRLDLLAAQGREHDQHPGVGLGEAPEVWPVEDELLHLAGLLAFELARGVGSDLLEHLPAIHPSHRRHPPASRSLWRPSCSASARSIAARPPLTQPLAVPSGTCSTSAISA